MGRRGFRLLATLNSLNRTSPARQLKGGDRGPCTFSREQTQCDGRAGGGKWIRTLGPSRLILGEEKGRRSIRVDPSCSTGESVFRARLLTASCRRKASFSIAIAMDHRAVDVSLPYRPSSPSGSRPLVRRATRRTDAGAYRLIPFDYSTVERLTLTMARDR